MTKFINNLIHLIARFFEQFIYGARWLIAPMYVGLVVASGIYTYKFGAQLYYLCSDIKNISESDLMIQVISLVDSCMIGNLLVIIIVGSYTIFIRPMHFEHDEAPFWLKGIDSTTLKTKIGMSLIGISSVHLLKDFIQAATLDHKVFMTHVIIHLVFLVSTVGLALIGRFSHHLNIEHPIK